MPRRALEGRLVLELGQVYNVPYCALLLAHLGADVIKIEPPLGEPARHRAAGQDSAPFLLLNAGTGIPAAPVLTLKEVVADPQIAASGILRTVQHPRKGAVRVFGNPLNLSSSPPRPLEAAPALGEHTRVVLRERLQMSEAEIDGLAADGVI